jgi:hypothetical protein
VRRVAAALLVAGCSNVLGLGSPREATDAATARVDSAADATSGGSVHVTTNGGVAGVITSEPAGIACPGTCDATFAPGATVTLSATDPFHEFTGFHGGPCPSSGSGADPLTCTFAAAGSASVLGRYFPQPLNFVFVTSTTQAPGTFDSVAGADALCNQLAGSAGVPGDYVAWLATNEQTAISRVLVHSIGLEPTGWFRIDGRPFAEHVADLEAGHVLFPARLDEFGDDVGDDALVATGVSADGTSDPSQHCEDWASEVSGGPVLAGEAVGGTGRWDAVTTVGCGSASHLYCVGTADIQSAFPFSIGAITVFVTKGTIAGGAGVGGADGLCESEASAAGLPQQFVMALITPGGGQPISARFTALGGLPGGGGNVQRVDHVEIAVDPPTFAAGSASWESSPNVAADGTFVDADMWLGGGGVATFESDCDGWTSSSSALSGATRPAATTRAPTFFETASCDQQKHVLCATFPLVEAIR